MNIAFIGLGRWGKKLMREFSTQTAVVYCHTSGNAETKTWLSKCYPAVVFVDTIDSIWEDDTVDAVVIATPIPTHFEIAKQALTSRKHVFLEKSPTLCLQELVALDNLAKERQRALVVDHIFSFREEFDWLKNAIKSKKICSIVCEWMKFGSFKEDICWNLVYHFLYLICDLVDDPGTLRLLYQAPGVSSKDCVHILLKGGDVNSSIYINRLSVSDRFSLCVQTDSMACVWDGGHVVTINIENGSTEEIGTSERLPMQVMIADFIKKVESEKYGLLTPHALTCVELLEALDHSS